MDQVQLNWITNFIWGIADDVLPTSQAHSASCPFAATFLTLACPKVRVWRNGVVNGVVATKLVISLRWDQLACLRRGQDSCTNI
jgi:hypothetical protein